ncbi:ABC transporter ATP-binding protein [Marinobacter sp. NSM]|uniref:ABC transporter ATP-binding protein n=1 Tax=Marinobacter sp. NSM TaxID=3458004 RepID=UPI004036A015
MPDLRAQQVTLGYAGRPVIDDLSVVFPEGAITVIVGANACGKSTLLKSVARLLKPSSGEVLLDGKSVHQLPTRHLARRLGMLPQSPVTPEGLTVRDLVGRGRFPHQGLFATWRPEDERSVTEALTLTGILELQHRPMDELSGGQRQRAWIAMALAQQTEILLLDEPTTFLDIAHRLEVLDLLHRLNRERGTTIVMVLHDLNEASRYADHLIAMRNGGIEAVGPPRKVVTAELVRRVFAIDSLILSDPLTGSPMVVPRSAVGVNVPIGAEQEPESEPVSHSGEVRHG